MKIILTNNVKGQGKKGEIIEVKDGYGMNFLIKKGLGVIASAENLNHLKKENADAKKELEQAIVNANKMKEKLESMHLIFKVKAGKQDQIFGTVSPKQIAESLDKNGISVDKKKIKADGINSLGYHNVEIELHKNVIGKLKIELVKEN